ncbi:unnamed protein product [Bursaphelenchus xylophilus]|uniref:(pine wood nematode) hypothetical protein n=1 Tax=Bursaphelenchus xylophilus TaxID=6326 RepID=A0A1I7SCA5_BURXY|nr:unnamed protein product [Bursaphelenchus xylophilus]CAG9094470.1 unnamed protein product [Bursaphelenchus xylophilus]
MYLTIDGYASIGWEKNALGFEATLFELLRNSTHRIIDANCQQFFGITQHQLTEQICEIYARYIQEDLRDNPYYVTDPLIMALYSNDSLWAAPLYKDLLEMLPTSTTEATHSNPRNLPPRIGTSPTAAHFGP